MALRNVTVRLDSTHIPVANARQADHMVSPVCREPAGFNWRCFYMLWTILVIVVIVVLVLVVMGRR
jgi:heme/copper-type cytochrome/quinol oxidase subunit 2